MDIQFQIRISFYKSKMAIAYFVVPEYGPAPVDLAIVPPPPPPSQQYLPRPSNNNNNYNNNNNNNNNRGVTTIRPRQNNNNTNNLNVTIDDNNNHVIPDLIHGVANFPQQFQQVQTQQRLRRRLLPQSDVQLTQRHSFIARLSMDWLSIDRFLQFFSSTRTIPSRQVPNSGFSQRGNIREMEESDDLPDVIPCHHGFSLGVSFESSRIYGLRRTPSLDENSNNVTPRGRCRRPAQRQHGHPIPLSTNQDLSPGLQDIVEDSWDFEIKVTMDSFEETGRELREVGDEFTFEFETSIERRRSAQQESFQFRCMLKIAAVPTLALLGLLTGVTYFRRHL